MASSNQFINSSSDGHHPDHREDNVPLPYTDKIELTASAAYDDLGYSYPVWRKWQKLCVMFCIQISINLNASLYANGVAAISKEHIIRKQVARIPQLTFLYTYAFGCELRAPRSEELGRWPTQYSVSSSLTYGGPNNFSLIQFDDYIVFL